VGAPRVAEVVQAGYKRVPQQQAVARQELNIADDGPAGREAADDGVIGAPACKLRSVGDQSHAFDSSGTWASRLLGQ
jgi:hypothetical protein